MAGNDSYRCLYSNISYKVSVRAKPSLLVNNKLQLLSTHMRFRKKRFLPSLAKAPSLRAIRTAYSVRYHVFNPKVNEQLCSISRQADFKLITINYGRLKHWLKKGLSFHPSNLIETDKVVWHKGFRPLASFISEHSNRQETNIVTKTKDNK